MASSTPIWGRYAELRPDELDTIREAAPIIFLPWGALDWHGPHLPLGVDGIIAEAIAEYVVRRTGGVLLPTTWWPGATLPMQPQTLAVRSSVMRQLWSDLFAELADANWHVVVLINGHHAREHEMALMEVAEEAIDQHNLLVLALPPLALIDDSLLDHAGLWESSLILSLHPRLVDLYQLEEHNLSSEQSGVQGRDPRGAASASLGDTVIHLAVERIVKAVEELLSTGDPAPLYALYDQRRERHLQQGETE